MNVNECMCLCEHILHLCVCVSVHCVLVWILPPVTPLLAISPSIHGQENQGLKFTLKIESSPWEYNLVLSSFRRPKEQERGGGFLVSHCNSATNCRTTHRQRNTHTHTNILSDTCTCAHTHHLTTCYPLHGRRREFRWRTSYFICNCLQKAYWQSVSAAAWNILFFIFTLHAPRSVTCISFKCSFCVHDGDTQSMDDVALAEVKEDYWVERQN